MIIVQNRGRYLLRNNSNIGNFVKISIQRNRNNHCTIIYVQEFLCYYTLGGKKQQYC